MPRYFFHQCVGTRMMWDAVGMELPDLSIGPSANRAAEIWTDILAGRVQPNRILVVTDQIGLVLFVSAR
jgi:hypothetical protein